MRACGGSFYVPPLPFTPTGQRPWFYQEPLSLTKLQGLLKKMCKDAKVEGNFTNHSLRATGATLLLMRGCRNWLFRRVQATNHSMLYVPMKGSHHDKKCKLHRYFPNPSVAPYTFPQEYTRISEDFSVTPEEDVFLENIPKHAYEF